MPLEVSGLYFSKQGKWEFLNCFILQFFFSNTSPSDGFDFLFLFFVSLIVILCG